MESHTVTLGRTPYHYIEWSNPGKPKMVLLHGMKVEAHCWQEVSDVLKADFHIYALDLKGHGKTAHGTVHDPDYTPAQISSELKEFYDNVIQEPFHIAGYSLGGQYAMNYAALYPGTLKSLILLDTAPEISLLGVFFLMVLGGSRNRVFPSKAEFIAKYEKHGMEKIGRYMAEYTLKARSDGKYEYRFDEQNLAPKTSREYRARVKELWEDMRTIQVPTIFLVAEKSQIVSSRILRKMKQAMPKIEITTVPKVGHEMVFSAPQFIAGTLRQRLAD